MTKHLLTAGQSRLLDLIEELGFGRIEQLSIHDGEPCYDRSPRIVEEIKLGSMAERRPGCTTRGATLKKEFESLFNHLSGLSDGTVDIEIRHGLPFKLVLERCHKELSAGAKSI
jgi:hypothetical protein